MSSFSEKQAKEDPHKHNEEEAFPTAWKVCDLYKSTGRIID
ncbi:hypothetical protein [Heyndrickxia acidicola]|uniref:Uncharacterized protein n=1 Tax=Heyndrickxia acidicola TaxID=209389 RepID=A0ABU6MLV4_9BACI|nr:hypothetical protein [Heyndrickxia acidicola]MED1204030.1 hypothetical protein [Heyndrickxia acidicola]